MSKQEAQKKNTNLKRVIWVALVIFAIALTGLWTFEPEIMENEPIRTPEGEVQSQIRIPLGSDQQEEIQQPAEAPQQTAENQPEAPATPKVVVKKVTEDSVVRPAFISDLSQLLVKSYQPAGSPTAGNKAKLLLDAKEINIHYGIEMTGLSWSGDDLAIGRRSVMRYALRPTMINALYALYKQRLITQINTDINNATRPFGDAERKLNQAEKNEFYKLAAKRIRATAGVLKSCAKVGSSMTDISVWLQSERDALDANQRFQTALHNYQVSKDMKATKSVTESAEKKMQEEGTAYENAIRSREEHKAAIASMIRKFKWTKDQDDETNLYIASWVYRRSKDISNPKEVMMTIQDLLLDLASTMEKQEQG